MIEHNLRIRLGQLIEKKLEGLEEFYESYHSGLNDVKHFFYTVADFLKAEGFTDDEVLDVYRTHGGNYLLGKKYGVSARSFADSIIQRRKENNSEEKNTQE